MASSSCFEYSTSEEEDTPRHCACSVNCYTSICRCRQPCDSEVEKITPPNMQTLMSQIWKITSQIWKITSKKTRNRDITWIRDKRAYLTQRSWEMSLFEINVSLVLRKLAITMQWSFHWPLLQKHRVSQRNIKITSNLTEIMSHFDKNNV